MLGWLKRILEKGRESAEENWFVNKCTQSDLSCDKCGGRLPRSSDFGQRGGCLLSHMPDRVV
jgi:hypothetical protein